MVQKIPMRKTSRPKTSAEIGAIHGFRSGLEKKIADYLTSKGVGFSFEATKIKFKQPEKERTYTPDFVILHNGIIVETKGHFVTADRQKHLWVKEQHPHLDIRFVFSNSRSRLNKRSPTTYGMWCEKNGFKYADKIIPDDWLLESPKGETNAI